jgi:hypothetical protein
MPATATPAPAEDPLHAAHARAPVAPQMARKMKADLTKAITDFQEKVATLGE